MANERTLHLPAIAYYAEGTYPVADFCKIDEQHPASHSAGAAACTIVALPRRGIPAVMSQLRKGGLINEKAMTVFGKPVGKMLTPSRPASSRPGGHWHVEKPGAPHGRFGRAYRKPRPQGATSPAAVSEEMLKHSGGGWAWINSEDEAFRTTWPARSARGDVVVVRYEGPRVLACRRCSPPPRPWPEWGWKAGGADHRRPVRQGRHLAATFHREDCSGGRSPSGRGHHRIDSRQHSYNDAFAKEIKERWWRCRNSRPRSAAATGPLCCDRLQRARARCFRVNRVLENRTSRHPAMCGFIFFPAVTGAGWVHAAADRNHLSGKPRRVCRRSPTG